MWVWNVDSKCGHVLIVLFGHRVQFGFECVSGQKIFFGWLPIYWAYQNFSVCLIYAYDIMGVFQKWLDNFVVDLVVGDPFFECMHTWLGLLFFGFFVFCC